MRDIDYHIRPRTEPCPECGSTKFVYHICGNGHIVMYKCDECGFSEAVPHIENYTRSRKPGSTPFMRWKYNVLMRDNKTCRICGSTDNPEAHHIIPVEFCDGNMMVLNENNGITLCKSCHSRVHGMDINGIAINVKRSTS